MTNEQIEAHRELWNRAAIPTSQGVILARFLLALFNGHEHKFDLIDLRALDDRIAHWCLVVLAEDMKARLEIHFRMGMTDAEFYRPLAQSVGILD